MMGKRNTIVVSSSDDEDKEFSLKSNYRNSKSKLRPSSVPDTKSKRAKKAARLSYSCSGPSKQSNGFDEIKLFCEDFDDGFTGFKLPTGCGRSNKDLWVDKHKPRSLEELAVHKKKVEEVKVWFEERLRTAKEEFCNNVLLITGPAGVGKSAVVHVIASHLRVAVCEWNTPTPTIWQEHLHNSNPGIRYTSKLDEFENFVDRIGKYGMIPHDYSGRSQTSTILLIDDLPVANGKAAYKRLHSCLHLLVRTARTPTAILITDYATTDSTGNNTRSWEELQLSLQTAGACKLAFNPITVNSIKKTLSKICREEHCKATCEQIDRIAKASGGDIRHAITSLQYFCLKPHRNLSLSISSGTPTYSRDKSEDFNCLEGSSLSFGRDETLSLFHALGKFLHNKRETINSSRLGTKSFDLRERFTRSPQKMDAPEKVLSQAHGQARSIADFLHENVLDFLSEEAIDDAMVVASYLSDADFLLSSLGGMLTRNYEAENVVQSAAASVAVRGVLFGNFHPSPSRWHVIRRPKLWQVEQSSWRNKLEMVSQRCTAYNGLNLSDMSVVATERKPVLRWLGFRASEPHQESMKANLIEDDMCLDEKDNVSSDDEIEDW